MIWSRKEWRGQSASGINMHFDFLFENHAHVSTLPSCLWVKVVLSQSLHLLDREKQNHNARVCLWDQKWDKRKLLWFLVFFKTRRGEYSVWRLTLFIGSNHVIIPKQTQSGCSQHLPLVAVSQATICSPEHGHPYSSVVPERLLSYSHLRETVSPQGGSGQHPPSG